MGAAESQVPVRESHGVLRLVQYLTITPDKVILMKRIRNSIGDYANILSPQFELHKINKTLYGELKIM